MLIYGIGLHNFWPVKILYSNSLEMIANTRLNAFKIISDTVSFTPLTIIHFSIRA